MKSTKLIPFVLSVLLSLALLLGFVRFNTSDSVKPGVWFRGIGPPREGSYFRVENPFDDGVYGVYAGDSILKRVKSINDDGTLILEGDSEMAFDSRYYGAISDEYIREKYIFLI